MAPAIDRVARVTTMAITLDKRVNSRGFHLSKVLRQRGCHVRLLRRFRGGRETSSRFYRSRCILREKLSSRFLMTGRFFRSDSSEITRDARSTEERRQRRSRGD